MTKRLSRTGYGHDSEKLVEQVDEHLRGANGTRSPNLEIDVLLTDSIIGSAVRSIREAEYWITRWHGAELQRVGFTKKDGYWLVVVNVTYKGKRKVAFLRGTNLAKAIIWFGVNLANKSLGWQEDTWPK